MGRSFDLYYEGTAFCQMGYWRRGVDWRRAGCVDWTAEWMQSTLGVYAIKNEFHLMDDKPRHVNVFTLYYAPTRRKEKELTKSYYVPDGSTTTRDEALRAVKDFAQRHMEEAEAMYKLEKELER